VLIREARIWSAFAYHPQKEIERERRKGEKSRKKESNDKIEC